MSSSLQAFSALAHSHTLPEFLKRHAGFYLVKTDDPEGLRALFKTEVREFSHRGAPLRVGCEVVHLCPSANTDDLRVGRGPGCDVVLRDASVSKLHARLRLSEAHVEVVDQHSKNGTRINGIPVRPEEAVAIASETILHFGNVAAVLLDAESLYEQA
jgi:hypothetical protein